MLEIYAAALDLLALFNENCIRSWATAIATVLVVVLVPAIPTAIICKLVPQGSEDE